MLKKLVTLFTLLGLLFGTAVATSGTAAADRNTVQSCSNSNRGGHDSDNSVTCIGTIHGDNNLNIEIKNVRILTDNELNILKVHLNNFLNNNVVTVKDIQLKVVEIVIGKILIPITICQVKVVEIGKTNINVAKC